MMLFERRQCAPVMIVRVLAIFAIPIGLLAQTHVVSPNDLQKEVVRATEKRQHNLEAVKQFLSLPAAETALKSAHIDSTRVKAAVSTLSDEELAQLASRAEQAQAEFAAGHFSDRDLILIILAVAALILIIVAVR